MRTFGSATTLAGLFGLLVGCGTVSVPMSLDHPAEVNMTAYKRVAFGTFDGRLGNEFAGIIKDRMSASGFELLESTRIEEVARELKMSQSDIMDERQRVELGKMKSAAALVVGKVEGDFNQSVSTEQTVCWGPNGMYPCPVNVRRGKVVVSGSVDIIDVQTRRIVYSKRVSGAAQGQTMNYTGQPAGLDGNALLGTALNEASAMFLRSILPIRESVYVKFHVDDAIPQLAAGIRQAQLGDLGDAINTFKTAAAETEKSPAVSPKSVAKAYWNLGQAQLYGWQLDLAVEAFKKVEALAPGAYDTTEPRARIERLRQEMQKHKSQ